MIVALVIITKSLDSETRIEVNFKEISLHITVFVIFAVDCTYVSIMDVILAVKNFTKKIKSVEQLNEVIVSVTQSVDAVTSATVLDSVCGFILIYIFIKIYIVVRDSAEKIADEETNEPRHSVNSALHYS